MRNILILLCVLLLCTTVWADNIQLCDRKIDAETIPEYIERRNKEDQKYLDRKEQILNQQLIITNEIKIEREKIEKLF